MARTVRTLHEVDLRSGPMRMLGRDYLAKVARKTLSHQGVPEQAWDRLDVHRQEAVIDGVASVIQALDELGWTFVPPENEEPGTKIE